MAGEEKKSGKNGQPDLSTEVMPWLKADPFCKHPGCYGRGFTAVAFDERTGMYVPILCKCAKLENKTLDVILTYLREVRRDLIKVDLRMQILERRMPPELSAMIADIHDELGRNPLARILGYHKPKRRVGHAGKTDETAKRESPGQHTQPGARQSDDARKGEGSGESSTSGGTRVGADRGKEGRPPLSVDAAGGLQQDVPLPG